MNLLRKSLSWLLNFLKQEPTFNWRSLIKISIYIWAIALLFNVLGFNNRWQNNIAYLGCIILIIAFVWFSKENPLTLYGFSLSYWILVLLISSLIASFNRKIAPWLWIIWPPLSAVFAALPEWEKAERKWKYVTVDVRLKLLIWILIHLLVSCWIGFSLVIQDWLYQYPSLLADNFNNSNFVVKIQLNYHSTTVGAIVLNSMEQQLKAELTCKPWSETELWLGNTTNKNQLVNQAIKKVGLEKKMWKIKPDLFAKKTGYNLLMSAQWLGPTSQSTAYHLKKVCEINQVLPQSVKIKSDACPKPKAAKDAASIQTKSNSSAIKITEVNCQAVTKENLP